MAHKTLEFDTETTVDQYAEQMTKHLLRVGFIPKPGDGTLDMSTIRGAGLPIGKIHRLYGTNPCLDINPERYARYAYYDPVVDYQDSIPGMVALRRLWQGEMDHRLTLKDLQRGRFENQIEKIAAKLAKFTSLLIDEHMLQNRMDPRKPELIRLMRLFIRGQKPNGKAQDEYRYGKLSMFDTGMGITIRVFPPEREGRSPPHVLVYNTVNSYGTKGELNLQEPPMVEANWEPDLADEALQLLREATVLDALAEL